MATAILAAAWLGTAETRRRGENPEVGWSLLLWAICVLTFACSVVALTQHPEWFGA